MISQPSGIDDQIDKVQDELKAIIQNLYNLIVQALDHQGSPTQEAMKREMYVELCYIHLLVENSPKSAIADSALVKASSPI